MRTPPEHLLSVVPNLPDEVRSQQPLVQCLTNSVVAQFTANALLAVGAAPAMVDIPDEAQQFAGIASAVLINVGTPQPSQRSAMIEAAGAAVKRGTPWLLDPVAVGVLSVRTALAAQLCELRPTVIRGNASEILALEGSGVGGRGVDARESVDIAIDAAARLAERTGAVIAVSGPVDAITDGTRLVRITNGHPLLTRITGGGCALGAVIAAFIGACGAAVFESVVAAVTNYTIAAELAADRSRGPGSFAVEFLDALASLDSETVSMRARLS